MNISIKLLCSNKKCVHVFEYNDFIYPLINDKGWAIFECPSCKYLTKLKVFNVDIAKNHPNVKDVYDEDLYLNHKEIDEIEEGEIKVQSPFSKNNKIPPELPICKENIFENNLFKNGEKARILLDKYKDRIESTLQSLKDAYLAGAAGYDEINRVFIKIEVNKKGDFILFSKIIKGDSDFKITGFNFFGASNLNIEKVADGVKNRDTCFLTLDFILKRWKMFAKEIYFVSPFIGFPQKSQKYDKQIIDFWEWLGNILDIEKTLFITRRSSLTRLKEAYERNNISFGNLKKWKDLNRLIELSDNYDGRRKDAKNNHVVLFQKSHAKFYAAVFEDYAEVVTGSYNIHTGQYLENLTLKKYLIEDFYEKFLKPYGVDPTKVFNEENKVDSIEVIKCVEIKIGDEISISKVIFGVPPSLQ